MLHRIEANKTKVFSFLANMFDTTNYIVITIISLRMPHASRHTPHNKTQLISLYIRCIIIRMMLVMTTVLSHIYLTLPHSHLNATYTCMRSWSQRTAGYVE